MFPIGLGDLTERIRRALNVRGTMSLGHDDTVSPVNVVIDTSLDPYSRQPVRWMFGANAPGGVGTSGKIIVRNPLNSGGIVRVTALEHIIAAAVAVGPTVANQVILARNTTDVRAVASFQGVMNQVGGAADQVLAAPISRILVITDATTVGVAVGFFRAPFVSGAGGAGQPARLDLSIVLFPGDQVSFSSNVGAAEGFSATVRGEDYTATI